MTAPKTRRTLSSLLLGSLLLCAAPHTASSQQNEHEAKQMERRVEACLTAPSEQALMECKRLSAVLSERSDTPLMVRLAIKARLVDVLVELGTYEAKEAPARKAVAAAQESMNQRTLAEQQGRLALVLKTLGKYSEAEELFRSATELTRTEYGAEDIQVAAAIGNLAGVLEVQGKLEDAESLFRKSLAIQVKKLGPDHPSLAANLGNLAVVLQAQGKLTEAELLFRKSLAIQEKHLNPDHPEIAKTTGWLAGVMYAQGALVDAEALFHRSLAMHEKHQQPDHPFIARTLESLSSVLISQGQLAQAESLLRKSLALQERSDTHDALGLATTMHNLAGVLYERGDLSEAESLYRKSLSIRVGRLKPEHPDIAKTFGKLAAVLQRKSQLADMEAESHFRNSLSAQLRHPEPNHLDVATALYNLAGVLQNRGQNAEAGSLYRRALNIRQKLLKPEHPDIAAIHSCLSAIYLEGGNVHQAVAEQRRHMQLFDELLRTSPTEEKSGALLASHDTDERVVYGLPLRPGAPEDAGHLAMSTALLFKARSMQVGRMVRNRLQQGLKSEELRQKYQTMLRLLGQRDQELTRMAQGSGSRTKAQELLWQAQKLERELSKEVGAQSSVDVPTLDNVTQKVAQSLPRDAVLVEVGLGATVNSPHGSLREMVAQGELHYVALLLFPKGEVRVVKLGGKDEVEEATRTFLAALNQPNSKIEDVARSAYTKLFAPLEKELAGVHQVILSPDGALSAIPFGALHDGKGYLADRLSLRYITSGRDLLNLPSQKPTTQPAVMMAIRVPGQASLSDAANAGREIALVQNAKLIDGATDGQVLALESPSVLTLISHGYFGGRTGAEGMSTLQQTLPMSPTQPKYMEVMGFERDITPQARLVMADKEETEDLMLSSGLLMMRGPRGDTDTKQDGRLTAVEVREMNLQGTKLVMLVACQGAVGGLSIGQGVYGLRRAVLQAGAETVVGTLWSVEEKSASELAKKYMTRLWTDKKATRVGAMEEAMKEMRKDPRYSHPHYWASFVVMGMDGPLAH